VTTRPSASVDLKKKRMSYEKSDTREICAYMSSDENTEVNVEVIGGAPELGVNRLLVIVTTSGVVVWVWGGGCGAGLWLGVWLLGGGL
jgi:hypothetical protein